MTIESLYKQMGEQKHLIQFWDEFSTLTTSFGMYKGGQASSHDRSIYMKLYNGLDKHDLQLKSENIHLIEPRLSILAAAHPEHLIHMLEEDKMKKSDGFLGRFNLCCANPVYMRLLPMKPYSNIIRLEKVFFLVKFLHIQQHNYTFDAAALELLDHTFNQYDEMCQKHLKLEEFIRLIY